MNTRIAELERDGVIDFTRQRDWYDSMSSSHTLTVIGGGGIGSLFTMLAGKLGINKIKVYDDDLVEAHNLPNQFFALNDFGHTKVDSLGRAVEAFTVSEFEGFAERVTAETRLAGIVVSGVDSMAARQEIAKAVYANRFNVSQYWDARLGGEKIVIYSVNPKDPEQWAFFMKTLHSDEEAVQDPCTRRSVIDVMGHVGSHLLTGVRKFLAGEQPPGMVYVDIENNKIFTATLEAATAGE